MRLLLEILTLRRYRITTLVVQFSFSWCEPVATAAAASASSGSGGSGFARVSFSSLWLRLNCDAVGINHLSPKPT